MLLSADAIPINNPPTVYCYRKITISRMMTTDWVCTPAEEHILRNRLPAVKVLEHPLKQMTVTIVDSKGTRKTSGTCNISNTSSRTSSTLSLDPLSLALDGTDPLSQFAKQEAMDPLSAMVAEYETAFKKTGKKERDLSERDTLSWASKRSGIFSKFTTSEKLSITTSFLPGGEIIKTQTTVSDKVKYRLEQLDDFEDGSMHQVMDLNQQEYIMQIEQLNHELVRSWNGDQRVNSLKIAIQCSKMLADTSVLQFYPSQFVLITDILDIFGKLVYERLRCKADCTEPGKKAPTLLSDNFTPDMISDSAKETCQNWFYKISSIRELIPRLYVEIAILKCYNFLSKNECSNSLLRLTKMIRGIGDPLVAIYARCYLVRVGMTVTNEKSYIKENLNDILAIYHTVFNGCIRSEINRQRIDMTTYLSLYGPALDWIIQGIIFRSLDASSEDVLQLCKDKKNNGPLLMSILSTFGSDFIASHAMEFVKILSNCNTEGITKGQLFRALGASLNLSPPQQDHRILVLNSAFATINTLTNPTEYIPCIEMWAQYTAEHFTVNEVNRLLEDITHRMSVNKVFENHYSQLQIIVDKIVRYSNDFEALLTLDSFLPILDLFQKESVKLEVCKNIITAYKVNIDTPTSDPVITNALMYICKVLNDSVNALTVEDERRQIGSLISNFIRKVDYRRDFEQQLAFYVEARAAFPNLDIVLSTLVHCVNRLAIETRKVVSGHHTRKTAAFVKACAAYSFITIPSIVSVLTQMDLYLLSGQVALLNLCLGQADACFETSLNLVSELPRTVEIEGKLKSTESYLVSYLCNMLSALIVVPDSPEQGVLYLVRLLLDVLKKYPFDLHSTGPATVYLHALDMLYAQSLESFPFHIPHVVSNDELYGSDPKFLAEVNAMCCTVVDQILVQLKTLGDANHSKSQTFLALELFSRIIRYADPTKDKMIVLASNLWSLAIKNESSVDPKLLMKVLMQVEVRKRTANRVHGQRLDELLVRMRAKLVK